jgi:hydroxymethylbilane synthase
MPTAFPDGIIITGYLPREDVRDALISPKYKTLDALPENGVVGTASLRRAALIKKLRPDLQTTLLRGNVDTRLRKAHDGEVDATLLALAGLKRLGLADRATMLLPVDIFPPAVGQGAVAITSRSDDQRMTDAIEKIAHKTTGFALIAERAFLTVLDGSCRTPIAGHATIEGDMLHMRGLFLSIDGTKAYGAEAKGAIKDAVAIGEGIARDILSRVPKEVLAQLA